MGNTFSPGHAKNLADALARKKQTAERGLEQARLEFEVAKQTLTGLVPQIKPLYPIEIQIDANSVTVGTSFESTTLRLQDSKLETWISAMTNNGWKIVESDKFDLQLSKYGWLWTRDNATWGSQNIADQMLTCLLKQIALREKVDI